MTTPVGTSASAVDVVFLGPSMTHAEARAIYPEAVYLPPAAMGDIIGVLRRYRPHAIGLVDGTFLTNMSVYHKELLYAMEQGVWVLGASSMGALRAAECDNYGMIGVGSIYERFVSGELEDDDEVALTHADASAEFRPLSDALVTIRSGLSGAVDAGLLSQDEAATLLECQVERWFPDRRLSHVSVDARALGIDEARCAALKEFMRTRVVDPKKQDAISLLERMRNLPAGPVPPEERVKTVVSGVFSALLSRDVSVETKEGLLVTFDKMRRYAVLHDSQYETNLRRARQTMALAGLSSEIGGPPTVEEIEAARVEVARQVRVDPEDLDAWATSQVVGEAGCRFMLTLQALCLRLESSWLGRARLGMITQPLLNEYRLAGTYDTLKTSAALQIAAAAGVAFDAQPSAESLLRTQAALGWQVPPRLLEYLDDHDLGTLPELLVTIDTSVRAHYGLFGIGLVDDDGQGPSVIEHAEPMMTRGS